MAEYPTAAELAALTRLEAERRAQRIMDPSVHPLDEPLGHVTSYKSVGDYETKDSGERAAFDSGMVRDVQTGKPRYDLIPLVPLKRVAELYARGAEKYGERNWEKAAGEEEMARFKASAFRHLMQALAGEEDEDHWAAVVFNAFGAMFLKAKLDA